MTNLDALVRVFAEVTGQPEWYVRSVALIGFSMFGGDMTKVHKELSNDEAERLLTELRKERANLLLWLIEGRDCVLRGDDPADDFSRGGGVEPPKLISNLLARTRA